MYHFFSLSCFKRVLNVGNVIFLMTVVRRGAYKDTVARLSLLYFKPLEEPEKKNGVHNDAVKYKISILNFQVLTVNSVSPKIRWDISSVNCQLVIC